MTRTARAKTALGYFHAEMRESFPGVYTLTEGECVDRIAGLNPWFLENFGKALEYATAPVGAPISEADVKTLMEQIARNSLGKFPTEARHLSVFFDALTSKYDLSNFATWGRLAGEVASATIEDVKTAAVVGFGGLAVYGLAAVVVFALAWGRKK